MPKSKHEIIVFDADPENFAVEYEEEHPIGHSRYGGVVVDLPPDILCPDLPFWAQLDLAKFAPHDPYNLLPKVGQLIFFFDIESGKNKIIYTEIENSKLCRHVRDRDESWGFLIIDIRKSTEDVKERYDQESGEWDCFAGSEKSKIFGLFTHCQMEEDEVLNITEERIVLLQVGENRFNDEGVFSVVISLADLKAQNFESCEIYWAQS